MEVDLRAVRLRCVVDEVKLTISQSGSCVMVGGGVI
jgi:hypothetical protein